MLTSLAIDIGNTNTKLGFFHGNALVDDYTLRNFNETNVKRLLKKYSPTNCILSNVNQPLSADLIQLLRSKTTLLQLNRKTKVPLNIQYSSSLGMDRLALAMLAYHDFAGKNALVVAAGTCITYNVVDKDGNFLGGAISPGLTMRLQAMHEKTSRLPKVKLSNDVQQVGDTTERSMNTGVVDGAAFEVFGFIEAYRQRYKNLQVILTGGDAAYLEHRIKFKIFARPNAVLEGLQRILQYNLGAH